MSSLSLAEIHLWSQSLAVPAVEFANLLAPDERERAARFRFDVHRNRYIVGRGRLRQILGGYLGIDPAGIVFAVGDHGKPSLAGGGELRFNLSHTGDLAVYAVTLEREVGVDVEQIRDLKEDGIPERFFSKSEVTALRSLPRAQQPEAFFNCWTRKEAYVKAHGHGLSIALDSFDVTLRPGDPARFLRNAEGWSMEAFRLQPDFVGAVVAEGQDWKVAWQSGD
jgi:4'-phosphopantetheinyl transferase